MDNTLINVTGICDVCKIELHDDDSWTEITVPGNLILPKEKPDIEQLISSKTIVRIIRQKVIVTPSTERAPNFEGKLLTGRKLIVEGEICQSITYTADLCNQPVHSARFIIPFSAYIVTPKCVRIIDKVTCCERTLDSLFINYQINPCVENVFIQEISKRRIRQNVLLFLHAIPVTTSGR
ncbi:DUF3794 domain-containing protein [Sporomusa termitida]|uniref:SipL SPOCS domain-containing protein n=1 Tax=Sporomusa termitida TaxID=2377 RepID=A0A517DZX5_9FIRM|nr:DUF3794 domain-containing protein [Sporomusa termitida]QDR82806.1 hypothetical protein SPTER_42370 [Sporomusa termitida]